MVARGAKGTDEELAAILDYLTAQYGPASPGGPRRSAGAAPGGRGRNAAYLPGSADKQVIDEAAANRGRKVYAAECINCHGTHARGSDNGADLIRSEIVLHDRYGSTIGPFLKKGHPTQTTPAGATHRRRRLQTSRTPSTRRSTTRCAPRSSIQNVLTGDAKAGAAYFNGAGQVLHLPLADGRPGSHRLRAWILPRCSSASSSPAAAGADAAGVAAAPARIR